MKENKRYNKKLTSPPGEWTSILKSYIYMGYLVFPATLVTGIGLYFYASKFFYISIMFAALGTVFLGYSMYSKMKGEDTWEQRIPISSELDKKKDLYLKIEKRFKENLEKSNFDFEEIEDPFPRTVVTVERHEKTGKSLIEAYEIRSTRSDNLLYRMGIFNSPGKGCNHLFNIKMKNIDKDNLDEAWRIATTFDKVKKSVGQWSD